MHDGERRSVHIGRTRRVPLAEVHRYVGAVSGQTDPTPARPTPGPIERRSRQRADRAEQFTLLMTGEDQPSETV